MPEHLLGAVGFWAGSLAMVSAGVAFWAFSQAQAQPAECSANWRRMARWAFGLHSLSVLGMFGILMYLLQAKLYAYQYAYAHTSNELSASYTLAAIWEGQEGSFLIWMVWNALLGLVAMRFVPRGLNNASMAVVALVQFLLAGMVVGVGYGPTATAVGVLLLVWGPWLALGRQNLALLWQSPHRPLLLAGVLLAAAASLRFLLPQDEFDQLGLAALFWLAVLAMVGVALRSLFGVWQHSRGSPAHRFRVGVCVLGGLLASVLVLAVPFSEFVLGSSPFLTIYEAFPNDETLLTNPGFVPGNGRGLNPLLQNYWMVIHPPTLFLGFSLSLFPFAITLAHCLQPNGASWFKAVFPWATAAALVLGIGILMGAYWAYDTLNFGGYWNWDPVENASLVPWLVLVGGLHGALLAQKARSNALGRYLLVLAFLLVLYSTFLTRSGILGNASVHSFTDLGLSGQLLVLLLAFVGLAAVALAWWERNLPRAESRLHDAVPVLWYGALLLLFASAVILLLTSTPVFNTMLGTRIAPPAHVPWFYYKWVVWFAMGVAVLSAYGQIVFWTRRSSRKRALLRSLLVGLLAAAGLMAYIASQNRPMVYDQLVADALGSSSLLQKAGALFVSVADELLLFCAVFSVAANLDVVVARLRTGRRSLASLGGALAHAGFAVMLLGVLFSAGYDDTLSINLNQAELASLPTQNQADNIRAPIGMPRYIKNYRITYLHRQSPQPPLADVRVITADESGILKVGFDDALGDRYYILVPDFFGHREGRTDAAKLARFVRQEYEYWEPRLLNDRNVYTLGLEPFTEETPTAAATRFLVKPETELDANENIISHPDRVSLPTGDVYVHVAGLLQDEEYRLMMDTLLFRAPNPNTRTPSDSLVLGLNDLLVCDSVTLIRDSVFFPGYPTVIRLHMRVRSFGQDYPCRPTLLVSADGEKMELPGVVHALGYRVQFLGVRVRQGGEGKVLLRIFRRAEDLIVNVQFKPLISLVWAGALLMFVGFGFSLIRRLK